MRRLTARGCPALLAVILTASCTSAPLGPLAGQESRLTRGANGSATLAIGNKAFVLRSADGKAIGDFLVVAGDKVYTMRQGKLELPESALKAGLRVHVPGYVPKLLRTGDAGKELTLEPVRSLATALAMPATGGRLAAKDGTIAVGVPGGLLGKQATALSLGSYSPEGAGGGLGVLLTIDGPIKSGTLALSLDLAAMLRGWDGKTMPPPWQTDPGAWTPEQIRQAEAAAKILSAGPNGAGQGVRLEGRTLHLDVPVGDNGTSEGLVRTEVDALAKLGVGFEVTVVSAVNESLPAAARPPGLGESAVTPRAGGAAPPLQLGTSGTGLIGLDAAALREQGHASLIGLDSASLIGLDAATLIGSDGAGLAAASASSMRGMSAASLIGLDGAGLIGPDGAGLVNNQGGALAGHVRVPIEPSLAKYRLRAYQDWVWPNAGNVRAVSFDGTPLSDWVPLDEHGNYTIVDLPPTDAYFFVEAQIAGLTLTAVAIAPGSKLTATRVTASTTLTTERMRQELSETIEAAVAETRPTERVLMFDDPNRPRPQNAVSEGGSGGGFSDGGLSGDSFVGGSLAGGSLAGGSSSTGGPLALDPRTAQTQNIVRPQGNAWGLQRNQLAVRIASISLAGYNDTIAKLDKELTQEEAIEAVKTGRVGAAAIVARRSGWFARIIDAVIDFFDGSKAPAGPVIDYTQASLAELVPALEEARDVAFDAQGRAWVTGRSSVVVADPKGGGPTVVLNGSERLTGDPSWQAPQYRGIYVQGAEVYALDDANKAIVRVEQGRISVAGRLIVNNSLQDGVGLTRLGDGTFYYASPGFDRIGWVRPDGVSGALGTPGGGPFKEPEGIAVGPGGSEIFVADTGSHTIKRFTAANPQDVVSVCGLAGVSGDQLGVGTEARFNQPSDIAFDSKGRMIVADRGNNAVKVLERGEDGVWKAIARVGSGSSTGSPPNDPRGVAVSAQDGTLAVAEFGGDKVSVARPAN